MKKTRKIFRAVALLAVTLTLLLGLTGCPHKGKQSKKTDYKQNTDYTLNADGKTLVKWLGNQKEINMKSDKKLNSVLYIGDNAFKGNATVETITLATSIQSIGASAFEQCSKLKTLNLSERLTSIGTKAFLQAPSLRTISISDAIGYDSEPIGFRIKNNCFYLYNSDNHAGKMFAYIGDDSETELIMAPEVTEMDFGLFYNNKHLKKLSLSNVEAILENSFANSSIEDITLSTNLKTIAESAFNNMKALTQINCRASTAPTIDTTKHFKDTNIGNITVIVPRGTMSEYVSKGWVGFKELKEEVLIDAEGNVNITDPKFLQALINAGVDTNNDGKISQSEAEAIEELNIISNGSINDLTGIEAFTKLKKLDARWVPIATINLKKNTALETLNISRTNLEHFSTEELSKLKTLNIHDSPKLKTLDLSFSPNLTSLDATGCESLYGIKVKAQAQIDNPPTDWDWDKDEHTHYTLDFSSCPLFYVSEESLIFGKVDLNNSSEKTLIIKNKGTGEITLNSFSITDDTYNEFSQDGVNGTKLSADGECTVTVTFTPTKDGIKTPSLNIDTSLGPKTIALQGVCGNYKYIPGVDYELDTSDLSNPKIKKWLGTQENIDMKADDILRTITYIDTEAFMNNTSLKHIILADSVTGIGHRAFKGSSLESITLNEGLTGLQQSCFNGTALKSISLPKSLSYINGNPFYYCTNLSEIKIADGSASFISKGGIVYSQNGKKIVLYPAGKKDKTFTIPNSVTSMAEDLFTTHKYLKTVTLCEGIKVISGSAFSYSSIETVSLPSTISEIPYGAFVSMGSLKTIRIKASTPPTLTDDYIFNSTDLSKVTLKVPSGAKKKYEEANRWKDLKFKEIIEIK